MTDKHIQRLTGRVVSTKMAKTAVVEVTRLAKHPRYKKFIRISKRYKAHDEHNTAQEGERVTIELTRPISREKHWKIVEKPS